MSSSYLSPTEIETLLRMSESDQLDFKSGQYEFAGAETAKQAELLKDILAFANAWKNSDAFILIGVEDTRTGRAKVVGVTPHLDDHSIQQFVNQKTNVPIAFEYIATKVDGQPVGIIRIAKEQPRPVFLLKKYVMLDANRVYIRRGSSTVEANPEEIAKMGEARADAAREPAAKLFLGEPKSRAPVASVTSDVVITSAPSKLFRMYASQFESIRSLHSPSAAAVAKYDREKALLNEVAFILENTGTVLIEDLRIRAKVPRHDGLILRDFAPSAPTGAMDYAIRTLQKMNVRGTPWVDVVEGADYFEIEARIPKIQPGTRGRTDSIWIGSPETLDVTFECTASADNLPKPIVTALNLRIEATTRDGPPVVSDDEIEEALADGLDVEDEL